jgi:hypothetical protein
VGNSDALRSVDTGHLHITYHHNYWKNEGTRGNGKQKVINSPLCCDQWKVPSRNITIAASHNSDDVLPNLSWLHYSKDIHIHIHNTDLNLIPAQGNGFIASHGCLTLSVIMVAAKGISTK